MTNIRYLSGFTGSEGVLLINSDKTNLLVDGRYTVQAGEETTDIQIIRYTDKIQGILQTIKKLKLKRIGFEANSITVDMYNRLTNHIRKEAFVDLAEELKLIRAYKGETEIALMKKAAEISSAAIHSLVHQFKPGFTEKEVALNVNTDVLFDFNSAEVKSGAAETLAKVAVVIRKKASDKVLVDGHTDSIGSREYNQKLSQDRARAVMAWLRDKESIPVQILVGHGYGKDKPVAYNNMPDGSDNPEGRARNRRVEIRIEKG